MVSKPEKNYGTILLGLKEKIRQARQRASLKVNQELLSVYWEIGKVILEQKEEQGWGSKVIKQLALDLKTEFPDMKGFSDRNLIYMQTFAAAYPDFAAMQQPAAQIAQVAPAQLKNTDNQLVAIVQAQPAQLQNNLSPAQLAGISWYHHTTLLDKVEDPELRTFYIKKTIENGWSRNVMVLQIESGLHQRQGALTHNFKNTLPAYQSDLTQQLFKDPYQFDFLMLGEAAKERDLENALMDHITNFLLELGDGFAFMGRQRKFEAGDKEYFIDLLFYHTRLRRHIIIELKIGEFEAEFVSKMNVYLGLADDMLKGEHDEPAIGLILCKTKNKIVAEYALRDITKPIGIAEYKITELLPENIKGELPSIEEIEQKLDEELKEDMTPLQLRLKAIKEKIKKLEVDEIQTPITLPLLLKVYTTGLKPLYERLITTLSEFNKDFLNHKIYWQFPGRVVNSNELDTIFSNDDFFEMLKKGKGITFNYEFSGFKKAGPEDRGVLLDLRFIYEQTWYGFTVSNHNNQQPFLKKMYHEQLTANDFNLIEEVVIGKLLDSIEWIMDYVANKELKN